MTTPTTTAGRCPFCGGPLPERRRSGDRFCAWTCYRADVLASLDERVTRLRLQADAAHDAADALATRAARLRLRMTAGAR